MVAVFLVLLFLTVSLVRSQAPEGATQKTFASPEQAGTALLAAAQSGDRSALIAIFGPDSSDVLFTKDAAVDKARLNSFVTAYNQMHRWQKIKAGGEVLQVGADNNPFPIPLGRKSSGQWYFDTAAGKDEIRARRIGGEELTAMDAMEALARAQQQYYQERHEYAQRFVSDPGTHNGLYWPAAQGEAPSPLGALGDFAKVQSSGNAGSSTEFNGYRYRILTRGKTSKGTQDYIVNGKMTGGFAILAYPVNYRNSGITSFLVGPDGTVYQRDLGANTSGVAAVMTDYNPSAWNPLG